MNKLDPFDEEGSDQETKETDISRPQDSKVGSKLVSRNIA